MTPQDLMEKFLDVLSEEGGGPPEDVIFFAERTQEVDFDFENCYFDWPPELSRVLGWQQTPDGIPFLGGYAGGDWEHPVIFITFWNEAESRAEIYVPERGNVVDWERKQAYWNEVWDEDDGGRLKPGGLDFVEGELLADIAEFLAKNKARPVAADS